MSKLSTEELERICFRLDEDIRKLREEFEEFKYSKFESYRDSINKRFDLRNDLTQQNAIAIQSLSHRMDMAGIPKQ